MSRDGSLVSRIATLQDYSQYADLHWEGTLEQYLEIAGKNPKVVRTAFQRLYDMILSYGREEYIDAKKKLVRYLFFKDEGYGGRDAIIDELYLRESHRGRGVGNQVLAFLIDFCRAEGINALHLEVFNHNERAYHFYHRHGFRERDSRFMSLIDL